MDSFIDKKTIYIGNKPWLDPETYEVYLNRYQGGPGNHLRFRGVVAWEPAEECEETPPAMVIGPKEAQRVVDLLWESGIRPRAAAGSAGQLDAVGHHLRDLQKLVFKDQSKSQ